MNSRDIDVEGLTAEIKQEIDRVIGHKDPEKKIHSKSFGFPLFPDIYPILGGRVYIEPAIFDATKEYSTTRGIRVHSFYEVEDLEELNILFLEEGKKPITLSHTNSLSDSEHSNLIKDIDKLNNELRHDKGEPVSYSKLLAFRQLLTYITPP